MTIYVNRLLAEPGCYVGGQWGQYGPDRMIEVAENFEMAFDEDDDPRYWRRAAEAETMEDSAVVRNAVGIGSHIARPEECWERHYWAADKVEELLNEATTGGYWEWVDGELFLVEEIEATEDRDLVDWSDASEYEIALGLDN